MATFTQYSISLDITGHTSSGQHVDGSNWVCGSSIQLSNPSPAPTGTGQSARHGAMWDPTPSPSHPVGDPYDGTWETLLQGYDGRVKLEGAVVFTDYDETKNVWGANGGNLPVTVNLAAGEIKSLVMCVSRDLGNTNLVSTWGANPVAIDEMIVITFYGPGGAPPANAFRPNYCSGPKLQFTTDDYNAGLLPNLDPPFVLGNGSNNPKGAAYGYYHWDIGSQIASHNPGKSTQSEYYQQNAEKVQYWCHAAEAGSQTALAPLLNQQYYPRDNGHNYGLLALYAMCNFGTTGAGANATENKASSLWAHKIVLQMGIDNYGLAVAGIGWRGGAGFSFRNSFFTIIYAGFFFNHTGMKTISQTATGKTDPQGFTIKRFSEMNRVKSSTNADAQYRYPRPLADYPNGPPLWGDSPEYGQDTPARPYLDAYQDNHVIRDPDQRFTAHGNPSQTDPTHIGNYPPYAYDVSDADNANVNLRNRVMENAGAYDQMAYVMVPAVLVTHILGCCDLWGNDALIDYVDWLTEDKRLCQWYEQPLDARYSSMSDFTDDTYDDDFYRFGGKGNGWVTKMWRTYRRNSTYRGKVRRRFGLKNTTVNIPVNYVAPVICTHYGTSNGKALIASRGKWRDNPTSWLYQWQRNGADISGSTNVTYTISTAGGDVVGTKLRVGTKGANSAGTAAAWVWSAEVTVT